MRTLPPEVKKGVRRVLDTLQKNPYLGKPLTEELTGFRSVAFKRYRIIYRLNLQEQKVLLDFVGYRTDIYRKASSH